MGKAPERIWVFLVEDDAGWFPEIIPEDAASEDDIEYQLRASAAATEAELRAEIATLRALLAEARRVLAIACPRALAELASHPFVLNETEMAERGLLHAALAQIGDQ